VSLLSAAGVAVLGQLEDVLLRQGRSIAGIVPQVVVEENHRDELVITNHPVQNGANITDHAYKQPAMVSVRYGWSNSGSIFSLDLGAPSVSDVYQMLLDLQASRQPFDMVTGKRRYSNMLIRSLDLVTDVTTENAVMVEMLLQQVIIVETQAATLKDASQMKMPDKTAGTSNAGVKQPVPVPESILSRLVGGGAQILGGL
jgi:hypothetical protein